MFDKAAFRVLITAMGGALDFGVTSESQIVTDYVASTPEVSNDEEIRRERETRKHTELMGERG